MENGHVGNSLMIIQVHSTVDILFVFFFFYEEFRIL